MKTFDLSFFTTTKADFEFNNLRQYRFYNQELKLGDKKYFVDFSFVVDYKSTDEEFGSSFSERINKIKIGFYINRKNRNVEKAHIWIKDYETNKRAAPETYQLLKDLLQRKSPPCIYVETLGDDGYYYDRPSYASDFIFEWSEEK